MIGKTISHYQILEKLGEGGMGVVYKARDTHLDRFVAIKVLPPEKVADPERKRRFVQEAKAASALNHPNIITVHDIDQSEGIDFIAMEYVDGRTLDELIGRKGLKLSEVLKVSVQMADALAAAHEVGIIHRDLKPGNVMVTAKGQVKVLDFGLAKLMQVYLAPQAASGSNLPTATAQDTELTSPGMVLGTVHYMSPEQAMGMELDARSDIFSFGSVLYEMVSGKRAFEGDSKLSTLGTIINKEPEPLRGRIPHDLEKVIYRCLRKDPARRFHLMQDVRVELEELKEESDSGKLAGAQPAVRPARRTWAWVGAALVVVAMAFAVWLFRGTVRKPPATPEVVPLTSYAGIEAYPSFSPDGNQVAFCWNGERQDYFDIYVLQIGSPVPVRLTTDPADDVSPAFSPDGRSIGFVRDSKEHSTFIVIPAIGGPERIVAEVPNYHNAVGPGFAWLPDGKWIVTDDLVLLSTESGERRRLTSPLTKSSSDFNPAVSPDGHTVAFSRSAGGGVSELYLLDLTEDMNPKGEPRGLTSLKAQIAGSAWTPDGREIIFGSAAGSWGSGGIRLLRVPASGGKPERLPFGAGEDSWPVISRSGNRLAYQRWVVDPNIWRLSLSGPGTAAGPPARFLASTRQETGAQYSPDGKRIAFDSDRNGVHGVWVSDADGSKAVELFSVTGSNCGTPRWSPDGQRIAFDSNSEENYDIYVIQANGGKPIRLTTNSADDFTPSWSRDGKWVYFASERTGRTEIWKVSAGGGEAVRVSRNGGGTPFESPDGKSVYCIKGAFGGTTGALWEMPVGGGEERQVLPSVFYRAYALVKEGIYFIPEPGRDWKSSIQFLTFATGKVKTVALMSGQPFVDLSVSPDGQFLLFSQLDQFGCDLMLVENFK